MAGPYRQHQDLHGAHKEEVAALICSFPNARGVLEKLNDDLSRTLEKVSKSERIINSNMSDVGEQYKSQS